MNGPTPTTGSAAVQPQGANGEKGVERKTSVPPGTVRSPSVVKHGGTTVKHTSSGSIRSTASQESQQNHTEGAKLQGIAAASRPGAAGSGADASKSGTGMRTGVNHGVSGTAREASNRAVRDNGAGVQPGTAGTTATTRITNAPRTTQVQASRISAEPAQQPRMGTERAASTDGNAGVVKPVIPKQGKPATAAASRFTQRPASATRGTASAASARTGGTEQAKAAVSSGTAAKSSPAPQETRTGHNARAASEQTRKPTPSATARQERAHSTGDRPERTHKPPISATARQESRLRSREGLLRKDAKPVSRPGVAGSAPAPARTSPKGKPERAPRQEQKPDAAESMSVETRENADVRKEDAENERTGE